MASKLNVLKRELLSYTAREKWFFLLALVMGFFIMAEYGITKPVSNSVFLTNYSSKAYPYVWLLAVPLNLIVVFSYNRLIGKLGCFRVFCSIALVTIAVNLFSAFYLNKIGSLAFLLYLWKDIYVMLMLQQLWSVINTSIKVARAKYLYGIVFGIGTLGSSVGSAASGLLATSWGSERLLLLTAPIYLFLMVIYYGLLKMSALSSIDGAIKSAGQKWDDLKLILNSNTLQLILFTVVFMQLSTTLMDYRFNLFLELEIPDQDLRTAFTGKLWALVHTANLFVQFIATFLLIQSLGLRKSQFFLPSFLFGNIAICLFFPRFSVVAYTFGTVKALDYSVFNIIKEILYVPLSKEEKFKARAFIDVFAYRAAKAPASLVIVIAQFLLPNRLASTLMWSILVLYAAWMITVYFFNRRLEWEKMAEA